MTDPPPSLAQMLSDLFPRQETRHIRWDPRSDPHNKQVYEAASPATLREFGTHLAEAAWPGPGALGLFPGFTPHGRKLPLTTWAMLDFDEHRPDDLQPLFELLRRQGLTVLFNGGTRDRGTHLWFLLNRPIPVRQAYASLKFLQRVVRELVGITIELRPSSPSGQGVGVFLPYRGAELDGYGANPLVDFATSEILSLPELASGPRQDAADFIRLGTSRSVQRFTCGKARPRHPWHPRLESVILEGEKTDRWDDELERLEELWEEGRRHSLTVAATCHGLNCGVPGEEIRRDLLDLARGCQDDELSERERAIGGVLARHGRGETISATHFYEEAGVPPPSKVSSIVRETIGELVDAMMADPWKTTAGKSARSVYKALLRLGWHHGHDHPEGAEVSVAWTQLEREANVGSTATLQNSLALLEQRGLLRRGLSPQGDKSGSFILLTTNRSTHITEEETRGYFSSSLHLRNGRGKLGKTAEQLFDLLLYFGPQSLAELAQRMDARPYDLHKHRDKLLIAGAIQEDQDGILCASPEMESHFARRFQEDGSLTAEERQEARIRERMARYRARRARWQRA
ncbi:hypothetical protein QOL99_00930 [Deinococcus sp. MIMF12]|uniref:Primase C-terminal 1 domain-containing protein n=1 Tax=Deinococcus rhizophilus TaxID=3049544 RepID=A0ABT7JCE3_9DEIO|nr:hypothetical protein [Deinococcus rhizophilus]MDL2342705.1 hypothetical protein [Deinococcus rhizophilus]